ncbi:MAG: hypothetical protein M3Z10_09015, partial [Gemmatimonadota bacterium]|nr:hypothetical protein [Gemmatimonadota bacterium]
LQTTTSLRLDPSDTVTAQGTWVRIGTTYHQVGPIPASRVASLTPASTAPLGAINYFVPIATGGRAASVIKILPPFDNWDADVLARVPMFFPALPAAEWITNGKAFNVTAGNHPDTVALDSQFPTTLISAAGTPIVFVVDDSLGQWSRELGDTSANPELSWEYWNGKGWWKLTVTRDDTQFLRSTGALQFDIPVDLVASDWGGKNNYWIRARLVGGDYGKETVTVTSTTVGGVTTQTVDRSSAGIRAPSVVKLSVSYRLCVGTLPTFVFAEDSGSVRDQSAANRTAGALVEAFVPLAVALGRLSGIGASAAAAAPAAKDTDCAPCDCGGSKATTAPAPTSIQSGASNASTSCGGGTPASSTSTGARALFLGLDGTPSGAPVNVFLLVDVERDQSGFAPLTVDAFVADHFVPLVVSDGTRGLGESGLISMTFTVEPTPRALFGQTMTWLRVSPATQGGAGWAPSIRGAYLNAVWAGATETLTRELLGSSEGAPNLTVKLARPPLLDHTLELRVRERLSDEERSALRQETQQRVLSDVKGLAGDWVLWDQVVDPLDADPSERVYSLDEGLGIIQFGDGRHGMIPPIGLDSIVAFSYQRTEPPAPNSDVVPGNLVAPRAPLNLVSPVVGVESVTAIDQSAGGAAPESDDRVLRFGFARLRHRNRAVTARDIEDLALQSSKDVAQARAFSRQGSVRLVVVMRGREPRPTRAQIRELRRMLLQLVPTELSATNALRIAGPTLHRLRVELTLRVDTLDHVGSLTKDLKSRLASLFDTTTGGRSQDGWPLGANPSPDDIAAALLDLPHLDSIIAVTFSDVGSDGVARPWPPRLAPTELAVLDTDPIRIRFETAEVAA